jgi:uncharacterized protein YcnI
MNTTTRSLSAIAAIGTGVVLAVAAPLSATAHVSVTPSATAAGSYSVLMFSVGHGCEGSPTTSVAFSLPDSIESVTPTVNPGWTIAETEGSVVYTAITPLPDDRRDTFELSVKLPEGEAGESIAIPVLQTCEVGSTDWAEITEEGEEEPAHPAPFVTLTEATGDAHGHAATDESDADETTAAENATGASSDDPIARWLGIGALVLGASGLALGLSARRASSK